MQSLIFASLLLLSAPVEGEWIVEFVDVEREGDKDVTRDEDTKTSKSPEGSTEEPDDHAHGGGQPGMPVINYYVRPLGKEPIPLDVSRVSQRELDSIRGFEWVRVTTEESEDPKSAPRGETVSKVEVLGFSEVKSEDSVSKKSSASPDKSSIEEHALSKNSSEPVASEERRASWPDDNPDDLTSSMESWNENQSRRGNSRSSSSMSSALKTRKIAMIAFQVQRASGLVSNAWGSSHIQNYFIDRTNLAFDQMAGHIVDIDFDTNGDGHENVGDVFGPVVVQDNGSNSCTQNWHSWMIQAKAAVVAQHSLGTDINGDPIEFCTYGPAHPLASNNPPQCEFFDNVVGLIPPSIGCGGGTTFRGIAQGGPSGLAENQRVSKNFAVRSDGGGLGASLWPPRHHVFLHELGHNMGLAHSGAVEEFHPAPWTAAQSESLYYAYMVYGDLSCAMGDTYGLFNGAQANAMGLFPDALSSSVTLGQFKYKFQAPLSWNDPAPTFASAPGRLGIFHALHQATWSSTSNYDEFVLLDFVGADGANYTLSFVTEVSSALPPPFEDTGDPDDTASPYRNYNRWLVVHKKSPQTWGNTQVIDKTLAPPLGQYLNAPIHYENKLLGVSFDTIISQPSHLVISNLNIGCVRQTPTVTAYPEVGVFGPDFYYLWTAPYPLLESLHHPGSRQDLTLTNQDSILCRYETFEMRAGSAPWNVSVFLYPSIWPEPVWPFWATATPFIYPGEQFTYRAYANPSHPLVDDGTTLGPHNYNLQYAIETRSRYSQAPEHILAPTMPSGASNSDALIPTYFDDISEPVTSMSNTSSSLISGRRIQVTWDAQNPEWYGSLPDVYPYPPAGFGCATAPENHPCIGKHPKDELHQYAVKRSINGSPWSTVANLFHVDYPEAMSWIDDRIPNSGGTIRYWISLVDRVGNESTQVSRITSQQVKPILVDRIDPELAPEPKLTRP